MKKDFLDTLHFMQTSEIPTRKVTFDPSFLAHSTVSTFGRQYAPPVDNLSLKESVEALIEGSGMSLLSQRDHIHRERAWELREGRLERYQDRRVGGTIVVHYIKKNSWFLETALALLEGDDVV